MTVTPALCDDIAADLARAGATAVQVWLDEPRGHLHCRTANLPPAGILAVLVWHATLATGQAGRVLYAQGTRERASVIASVVIR